MSEGLSLTWSRWSGGYRLEDELPDGMPVKLAKSRRPVMLSNEERKDGPFLVPNGGEPLTYRPLEITPPLVSQFILMKDFESQVPRFASKYGALRCTADKGLVAEYFSTWTDLSLVMVSLTNLWATDRAENMVEIFNKNLMGEMTVKMEPVEGRARPALRYVLKDLNEALWAQLAFLYSQGASARRCAHCNKLFIYGASTSRRKTGLYCSAGCRRSAWRKRQEAA